MAKNIVLPFSKASEKLENVLKRQGMNVCYNSRGNLKEHIGGVKRGRPKRERSGIYRIMVRQREEWKPEKGNMIGQSD